ncbi:alkaline phosphatase D family protein [Halomonas cupida]|uniref:alkaline phosphatase D family protein n=1 Tax=Halomonas cupida TaxID=44933 RepID=UPI003A948CF9
MSDNGQPRTSTLPDVLAGPILRRCSPERLRIWLVASRPLDLVLELKPGDQPLQELPLDDEQCRRMPLGHHATLHLIEVGLDSPLPTGQYIDYDLRIRDGGSIADWAPHLHYPQQQNPGFVITAEQRRLLHGSCRRPHFDGPDGLAHVDGWLEQRLEQPSEWPSWLLMTGDQVYADDVAGPMLVAIHELIARLGLFDEPLEAATLPDSQALYSCDACYYHRQQLLPDVKESRELRKRFFGGARKPVFTSASANNHLMTFAEVIAMYLLVWSPTPWRLIDMQPPELSDEDRATYDNEAEVIERFVATLPAAARVMANLPTLMIFDDHDITDDWNLTADWERTAYGHPFSRRIIGNALLGYLLCQGWGNDPQRLATPLDEAQTLLEAAAANHNWLDGQRLDEVIRHLLRFEGWGFEIDGNPKLVALDTRTRRWRSERDPEHPSGLMDWEALSELQQQILGARSVIIVSPAPMFGVKLIEIIQKLFTMIGKPLLVDAENWMAHRGAANTMLNIFRHSRTPGHYVVLSGDVHYSFVYDILIRHRREGPKIWQVTSSGIKNCFPDTLLDVFDRLNRWLFSPRSPLNWFTRRRPMAIRPRDPDGAKAGERLWNGPGMGLITLAEDGSPEDIRQLDARGMEVVFPPPRKRP